MITAILSDIHANEVAMEAVLADAKRHHVEQFLCLGDIVGYGPKPLECFNRMMDLAKLTVMGNHEAFVGFAQFDLLGLREDVADGIVLARSEIDSERMEIIRRFPITARVGDVCLVHSSLEDPSSFPYVHEAKDAKAHFSNQPTRLAFIGHSHVPEAWYTGGEKPIRLAIRNYTLQLDDSGKYLVNVGSVGQPRDGDRRASYVLFDDAADTVRWRRINYDINATITAMAALGMPKFSSSRLLAGI